VTWRESPNLSRRSLFGFRPRLDFLVRWLTPLVSGLERVAHQTLDLTFASSLTCSLSFFQIRLEGVSEPWPQAGNDGLVAGKYPQYGSVTSIFHTRLRSPRLNTSVIPRGVAIGLGGSGNRPGQCQAPWKYLGASSPHRKFNQVLRPESHEALSWPDYITPSPPPRPDSNRIWYNHSYSKQPSRRCLAGGMTRDQKRSRNLYVPIATSLIITVSSRTTELLTLLLIPSS
jgi:hypothetical protein